MAPQTVRADETPGRTRRAGRADPLLLRPLGPDVRLAEDHAGFVGGGLAGVAEHRRSYTSAAFPQLCGRWGVAQPMGRVGSALDNAAAESFHSVLKVVHPPAHLRPPHRGPAEDSHVDRGPIRKAGPYNQRLYGNQGIDKQVQRRVLTGISGVDVATKHTNGAAPAGAAPRCRVTRPGGRLGQPTACSDPRLLAAAAFFAAAAAARFLRCSASWSW